MLVAVHQQLRNYQDCDIVRPELLKRIALVVSRVLSGDLSYFGGPVINEAVAGRVRAEQIGVIFQYLPWMMLANASNALIAAVALRRSPDWPWILAWAATIVTFAVYFCVKSNRQKKPKPISVSRQTIQRATRNAFLFGCLWAAMPLFFFAGASNGGQLIITCLCAGMLGGGALAFASIPVAAIAFTSPIFLTSGFVLARNGDEALYFLALLLVVYTCILLRGIFVQAFKLTRRHVAQIAAENEARTDALTNLPNRVAFREYVESALSKIASSGGNFALLYLDLNDFKIVNDKMGHAAGDALLVQVADRLRLNQGDSDFIARVGGDEFVLIAANIAHANDAMAIAQRIVRAIDAPFAIHDSLVKSSVTIGIAMAPHDGADFDLLVKNADTALYTAKRSAGEVIQIFDPEYDAMARDRRAIGNDLRYAIERQELHLVYQPLQDLVENRIIGCEALLRWTHPTRGPIPPLEFIGIAEETQLINSIGEWVIREACQTASTWPQGAKIAVNLSAVQLKSAAILSAIVNALADAALAPAQLEIEVTESVLISDDASVLATLNALHHLGVRIALDDFGTGYSSLNYLGRAPFDRIKIDRTFIQDLLTNSDRAAIVKALIGLAGDLKMSTTAEGVENAEQLNQLRRMNCSEGQGNFIGVPKTAAEIAEIFNTKSSMSRLRLLRA